MPFVGIVELGRVLLADGPINSGRVWAIVAVVIGALLVRTLASGMTLTITHFADVNLQRHYAVASSTRSAGCPI